MFHFVHMVESELQGLLAPATTVATHLTSCISKLITKKEKVNISTSH